MLVTGGENQTIMGGMITFIYFLSIIFITISLLQEQFVLNEWIDSTQMASQNSDVMVTNTLKVETTLSVT